MKLAIITFSFIILALSATAQQADTVKNCEPQSLGSVFRKKSAAPRPPKEPTALILPNISSNPANGFLLGIGGSLGWWFGPKETTRISFAGFTVAYTTKDQLISFIKTNSYTRNDKFFLQGDWRYYIYSAATYGLGTNSPDSVDLDPSLGWMAAPTGEENGGYQMQYDYPRLCSGI